MINLTLLAYLLALLLGAVMFWLVQHTLAEFDRWDEPRPRLAVLQQVRWPLLAALALGMSLIALL